MTTRSPASASIRAARGLSENSIESILASTSYGGSVVEIDVHRTADNVPILFHDDTFGPRLTNGPYCHGPIDQATLAHVRAFCPMSSRRRSMS